MALLLYFGRSRILVRFHGHTFYLNTLKLRQGNELLVKVNPHSSNPKLVNLFWIGCYSGANCEFDINGCLTILKWALNQQHSLYVDISPNRYEFLCPIRAVDIPLTPVEYIHSFLCGVVAYARICVSLKIHVETNNAHNKFSGEIIATAFTSAGFMHLFGRQTHRIIGVVKLWKRPRDFPDAEDWNVITSGVRLCRWVDCASTSVMTAEKPYCWSIHSRHGYKNVAHLKDVILWNETIEVSMVLG